MSTPEDAGTPICHFYDSLIEPKMRCATLDATEGYLQMLYQGRVTCTERVYSKEWPLIAALDGAEIPAKHRVSRDESVAPAQLAWNQGIYDAGLKTQNYDTGFERFVRKFGPDVAIVKGPVTNMVRLFTSRKARAVACS
jgi:hypothetical protein